MFFDSLSINTVPVKTKFQFESISFLMKMFLVLDLIMWMFLIFSINTFDDIVTGLLTEDFEAKTAMFFLILHLS